MPLYIPLSSFMRASSMIAVASFSKSQYVTSQVEITVEDFFWIVKAHGQKSTLARVWPLSILE